MFVSVQVLLTGFLVIVTLIGDQLVVLSRSDWQRAIADNATHGIIGLITWLIVSMAFTQTSSDRHLEIVLCGLLASAIDADHFIAARSINLQDARQIPSRPFLHCTSMAMAVCAFLIIVTRQLRSALLHHYAWLVLAAFVSHHTRDATRRGFWLWPGGSTPPVPHALYVSSIAAIPHMVIFVMHITIPAETDLKSVTII